MEKINAIKLFFYNHKKIIGVFVAIFVATLSLTLFAVIQNKLKGESIVYENLLPTKLEGNEIVEENNSEEKDIYYVDIKGEVNNPGVYALPKGKRVVDALNQAGGLKEGANTSFLNLSLELADGMVIKIYSDEEILNYGEIKETEQEKQKICTQDVFNDACISNSDTKIVDNAPKNYEQNDNETEEELKEKDRLASEKININTASQTELMTLNKIGESKAKAIIQYRTEHGKFKSIEEIKNVSGIGDSIFEAIKPYITI